MAAQYVTHDEYNEGMNILFARLTRYFDSRFDVLGGQMLADKQELKTEIKQLRQETNDRFSKIEQRLSTVESTQADILKTQSDIVKTLSDVVTHQQTLLTTFNTTTQAIVKTMQDNHAEAMEAINDAKVRVTKLEEKDK